MNTSLGRLLRSPGRVLLVAGCALLPWTVVLGHTLPSTYAARNWSTAWVGLDLAMAAGAVGTGLLHRARDRRAAPLAAATGALALADLWFDVLTSAAGRPLVEALGCGVVELTFVAFCAHVALDGGARGDRPAPRPDAVGPVSVPVARRP